MNYTATIYNKTKVRINNTINGAIITTISANGEILGSPIINGDRLSVVTKQGNKMYNTIFSVPAGKKITTIAL